MKIQSPIPRFYVFSLMQHLLRTAIPVVLHSQHRSPKRAIHPVFRQADMRKIRCGIIALNPPPCILNFNPAQDVAALISPAHTRRGIYARVIEVNPLPIVIGIGKKFNWLRFCAVSNQGTPYIEVIVTIELDHRIRLYCQGHPRRNPNVRIDNIGFVIRPDRIAANCAAHRLIGVTGGDGERYVLGIGSPVCSHVRRERCLMVIPSS